MGKVFAGDVYHSDSSPSSQVNETSAETKPKNISRPAVKSNKGEKRKNTTSPGTFLRVLLYITYDTLY